MLRARSHVATALGLLALAGCAPQTSAPSERDLTRARNVQRFPVYWVGMSFRGVPLRQIARDPGGSWDVQYGDCIKGVETCSAPLVVVTVPDPTFVPGAPHRLRSTTVRGVPVYIADGGRTVQVPTGSVVVNLSALDPGDALAAARQLVAINRPQPQPVRLPPRAPKQRFQITPDNTLGDRAGDGT